MKEVEELGIIHFPMSPGARFLTEPRSGVKKCIESPLLYRCEFLNFTEPLTVKHCTLVTQQAFLLTPHLVDRSDVFQNRRR